MLDLNLDADSPESAQYGDSIADRQTSDVSGNRVDESGTSKSSVINAEADEDSSISTRDFTLSFDILKVGGGGDESAASNSAVTKELFPVAGGHLRSWIDLSFDTKSVAPAPARKSRRGPRSRSSQYRGVTFYRRTGRWESHIWDCGKQVYLGRFDTAHAAARAFDRAAIKCRGVDAAIKCRGVDAAINFTIGDYEEDMKQATVIVHRLPAFRQRRLRLLSCRPLSLFTGSLLSGNFEPGYHLVSGSVNGFVCLVRVVPWLRVCSPIIVYNPTTRQVVELPKVTSNYMYARLGYDPVKDQYKVLCVVMAPKISQSEHVVCTVSSSEKQQWRKIENTTGGNYHSVYGDTYIDGAIYYGVGKSGIVKFVRSEKTESIKTTQESHIDNIPPFHSYKLQRKIGRCRLSLHRKFDDIVGS